VSALARALRLLWALPWTLLGLLLMLPALAGGQWRHCRLDGTGALCGCGGGTGALLRHTRIAAITLGHTVLARDAATLQRTLAHELAHVRQYERWGLLFPFLYFWASWQAWRAGGHAYFDNRYEVEARRAESPATEA